MPTLKQMYDLWDSEMLLRRWKVENNAKQLQEIKFTGKTIGTIAVNPETKELQIKIDKEESE